MKFLNSVYTAPLVRDILFLLSKNRLPNNHDRYTPEEILELAYSYRGFGIFRSIEPSPRFPHERVEENIGEYAELAILLDETNPKTVLEIGTARGGSFYLWCKYLDSLEQICSIDLGSHIDHFQERTQLFNLFADVKMDFVIADSHSSSTRDVVGCKFDNKVDFLMIDADHSYEGVKSDFEMYRDLVSDNGIIAFHDIVNDEWPGVGKFWHEIRSQFKTTEIIKNPGRIGIGVIESNDE